MILSAFPKASKYLCSTYISPKAHSYMDPLGLDVRFQKEAAFLETQGSNIPLNSQIPITLLQQRVERP